MLAKQRRKSNAMQNAARMQYVGYSTEIPETSKKRKSFEQSGSDPVLPLTAATSSAAINRSSRYVASLSAVDQVASEFAVFEYQ
jgi:hypothetical protein